MRAIKYLIRGTVLIIVLGSLIALFWAVPEAAGASIALVVLGIGYAYLCHTDRRRQAYHEMVYAPRVKIERSRRTR